MDTPGSLCYYLQKWNNLFIRDLFLYFSPFEFHSGYNKTPRKFPFIHRTQREYPKVHKIFILITILVWIHAINYSQFDSQGKQIKAIKLHSFVVTRMILSRVQIFSFQEKRNKKDPNNLIDKNICLHHLNSLTTIFL